MLYAVDDFSGALTSENERVFQCFSDNTTRITSIAEEARITESKGCISVKLLWDHRDNFLSNTVVLLKTRVKLTTVFYQRF